MSDPTDEQLARFISLYVYGPGHDKALDAEVVELVKLEPIRAVWLERHRAFQEALDEKYKPPEDQQ